MTIAKSTEPERRFSMETGYNLNSIILQHLHPYQALILLTVENTYTYYSVIWQDTVCSDTLLLWVDWTSHTNTWPTDNFVPDKNDGCLEENCNSTDTWLCSAREHIPSRLKNSIVSQRVSALKGGTVPYQPHLTCCRSLVIITSLSRKGLWHGCPKALGGTSTSQIRPQGCRISRIPSSKRNEL
jgi:hypothetical protein